MAERLPLPFPFPFPGTLVRFLFEIIAFDLDEVDGKGASFFSKSAFSMLSEDFILFPSNSANLALFMFDSYPTPYAEQN